MDKKEKKLVLKDYDEAYNIRINNSIYIYIWIYWNIFWSKLK